MDPRELEEYPICSVCKQQIDLQEGPICLNCQDENDDYRAEFDALTIYRNLVNERLGRPLTDEEWDSLTERIARELDEAGWTVVDKAINDLKG